MRRCAVIIGVNSVTDLPSLASACNGAFEVAKWASGQCIDYVLLTDNHARVTAAAICDAVRSFVDSRKYSQMIIYFSGHGILLAPECELWLLSSAPDDVTAAVNLPRSIIDARRCSGISHVVFISDACRSIPPNSRFTYMIGGSIFPNYDIDPVRPMVDSFYASLPGDPAYEMSCDTAVAMFSSVFTKEMLNALNFMVPEVIVRQPSANNEFVVPSMYLKKYLEKSVPRALTRRLAGLVQEPDIRVESDHPPKYLSHVVSVDVDARRRDAADELVVQDNMAAQRIDLSNGAVVPNTWSTQILNAFVRILHSDAHESWWRFFWEMRSYRRSTSEHFYKVSIDSDRLAYKIWSGRQKLMNVRPKGEHLYIHFEGNLPEFVLDNFGRPIAFRDESRCSLTAELPADCDFILAKFNFGSILLPSSMDDRCLVVANDNCIENVSYLNKENYQSADYRLLDKLDKVKTIFIALSNNGLLREEQYFSSLEIAKDLAEIDSTIYLFLSYACLKSRIGATLDKNNPEWENADRSRLFLDSSILYREMIPSGLGRVFNPVNLRQKYISPIFTEGYIIDCTSKRLPFSRYPKMGFNPGLWLTYDAVSSEIIIEELISQTGEGILRHFNI